MGERRGGGSFQWLTSLGSSIHPSVQKKKKKGSSIHQHHHNYHRQYPASSTIIQLNQSHQIWKRKKKSMPSNLGLLDIVVSM